MQVRIDITPDVKRWAKDTVTDPQSSYKTMAQFFARGAFLAREEFLNDMMRLATAESANREKSDG